MESLIDKYNLGVVDGYLEDGLILKPMVVLDGSGYERFKIEMSKEELDVIKSDEMESENLLVLPYNNNKKLIEIDEYQE